MIISLKNILYEIELVTVTQSCKFSGYGNCNSDEIEDGFCLFHKSHKGKEERVQFYQELLDQVDVREEPAASYDVFGISEHTRFVFKTSLDFSGYYFPKVPQKGGSFSFGFGNCIFQKAVSFRNARFHSPIFSEATFQGDADFTGSAFYLDADFSGAVFTGRSDFSGVYFKNGANFNATTFHRPVSFISAFIDSGAEFEGSRFNSSVDFRSSKFAGDLSFLGTLFNGDIALVDGAVSKYPGADSRIIVSNSIEYEALLDYIDTYNPELPSIIVNSTEQFVSQKSFPVEVIPDEDFTSVDLNYPIDEYRLEWMRRHTAQDERFKLPTAEQEACRVQKLSFERNDMKRAADKMFRREMRARRQAEYGSGFRGSVQRAIEWIIADFTSEYATNWKRVLTVSGMIVLLCAGIFAIIDILNVGGSLSTSSTTPLVNRLLFYLYYSLVTFTTLGSANISATGILALISAIEATVGTLLAALLVAVFIRTWRI